jgi:hypothetical protein
MTNCPTSPYGGAIIAALYLQEFVNKDITWVHFDVMVFNLRHLPGRPKGGGSIWNSCGILLPSATLKLGFLVTIHLPQQ